MMPSADLPDVLQAIQLATRSHQQQHACNAHTFEDGPGLWRLVQQHQPRHMLELGTGLGYTACLMALASPQGQVLTLEGDPEHAALARQQIAALELQQRVQLHEGSFATVMQALQLPAGSQDLVFFDGNMPPLILVQHFHTLLAPGGLLVCANIDLNGPLGARRVRAELADAQRWQLLPPLESGLSAWHAGCLP